ncbi:Sulfatase-modifying factor enzyme domain-containing protein [Desulfonema limicola]|uniref:Sulfatase-modifying factor enzyme domain-containing protein n=1 Tax=Desulfonema limicola TaxID=45656 RepID=A0A975B5Q8_9BACT|nr:formylglycine-generating enzyme family protein [Desulfonema limicola]QTA79295.1 Sulfatase-modifying factor enzyme domain-containing protein [Desulfonema limicola]
MIIKKSLLVTAFILLLVSAGVFAGEHPCRQRVIDLCSQDQSALVCPALDFDEPETVDTISAFLKGISHVDQELQEALICARLMTKKKILNFETSLDFSEDSNGKYSFSSGLGTFRFKISEPGYSNLIKAHEKIKKLKLCPSDNISFDIQAMVTDADAEYQGEQLQSFTIDLEDVKLSNISTIYTKGSFQEQCLPLQRRIDREMKKLVNAGISSGNDEFSVPIDQRVVPGNKPEKLKRFTNSAGMTFVLVPVSGDIMEDGFDCEKDKLAVTRSFYIGIHEVTQRQWESVMGSNPSEFQNPDHPVENVSWNDAQDFISRLNKKENTAVYRLPSEAQWEYAARAGSTTDYCFGDGTSLLKQYAWYKDNSGKTTHPVGKLLPNDWGIYDMHGNVYEWCQDLYNSSVRVSRGGSWLSSANLCRSSIRSRDAPGNRSSVLGFRVLAVQSPGSRQ